MRIEPDVIVNWFESLLGFIFELYFESNARKAFVIVFRRFRVQIFAVKIITNSY